MLKPINRILFITAAAISLSACQQQDVEPAQDESTQQNITPPAEFVGAAACANCHQQEFDDWQQSHHYQAMRVAGEDAVLADFNDVEIIAHEVKYRFYSELEDSVRSYWVAVQEPDQLEQVYQISYTFGYAPLQQYMVELENGHIQVLNMAWDSRTAEEGGQNWFHLRPDEEMSQDNIFHWERHYQNWNSRCADCHSTGLEKNYDVATHSYNTQWAEVNVACESCHGEGSRHVDLAQGQALSVSDSGFVTTTHAALDWVFVDDQPIASPVESDDIRSNDIDMCGRCHSLRSGLSEHASEGSYHDEVRIQVVDESNYFADGQLLEETFVLGSFLQSKMHAQGVTCANCHNPHTGSVLVEGNGLCLQCHTATNYDTVVHHQHAMDTDGAQCVSCHMPARTYMQVDARRDHSFVVPNAQVSSNLGTPNACLNCHEGEDAQWLQANLVDSASEAHWAMTKREFLDGGDALDEISTYLQSDQPAMRDAALLTALSSRPSQQSFDISKQQLDNPDPLIRRAALSSLASMPNSVRVPSALRLIDDPARSVRFEALSLLIPTYQQLSDLQKQQIFATLKEYSQSLALSADSPEGQLATANLALALGNFSEAEQAYQYALQIEPNYIPALINFADFYRASNRDELGRELLEKALALEPKNSGANFAYAMSLIRAQQKETAMQYLNMAAQQVDSSPYYHYVYAVGLNDLGDKEQAVLVVNDALENWPTDAGLLELSGQL